MNWDWGQIFRDAAVAIGLAFVLCVAVYLLGLYDWRVETPFSNDSGALLAANAHPSSRACGRLIMIKGAFDRWWEWFEKPPDSTLTIPAHFHDAVMQLPPERRRDWRTVNEAVRLADPDAQR